MICVDLELTNRCNADCHFCPRDMTPHQGLMSVEVFEQALARAVEINESATARMGTGVDRVNLCGLGEPLLNKRAPEFTRAVTDAGFQAGFSSNGALLSEAKAEALLDAGLRRIFLNVGEVGADYEAVYKLPWERTERNVTRFVELADGRCEVWLVLVDHRHDAEHTAAMKAFWGERGVTLFVEYGVNNRGGALFVDHAEYEAMPELAEARTLLESGGGRAQCAAPFVYLFVGYDGQYYLCCSDWKKEVPLGSVFDRSFEDVMGAKLDAVASREPVCRTCNLDPLNVLTDRLRAAAAGEIDRAVVEQEAAEMVRTTADLHAALERFHPGLVTARPAASVGRKLIPLTVR